MTIVTVQFDAAASRPFETLLRVFRESVRVHMPDVRFHAVRVPAPLKEGSRARNLTNNTLKLQLWDEYMQTATDDTIFADCDMLAMQPAYHAFDRDFDVAATFRPAGAKSPMNGGIVFARPTEGARAFMARWRYINQSMYVNLRFRQDWIRYLGMNQCAFGYLWETGRYEANLITMPCRTWNAVDDDWKAIGDDTVFVHFKSQLRHAVLHQYEPYGCYARAMEAWYEMRDRLPDVKIPKGKQKHTIHVRRAKQRGRVKH